MTVQFRLLYYTRKSCLQGNIQPEVRISSKLVCIRQLKDMAGKDEMEKELLAVSSQHIATESEVGMRQKNHP